MMPSILGNADVEDNYYEHLRIPVASLKVGLPVRELLNNRETEFEVKPDDGEEDNDETAAESCFDFSEIEKLVNMDMIDIEDRDDETPFDRYRRKMFDLTDDGKLKKYIVKQGVGPLVPENSVVYVRYQAYLEYSEVPFDSTMWQCSGEGDLPVSYNLAKKQLLPGLHEVILSMRRGEKAEVLVHPDLAFGQIGCPPRIPPGASILFIVEIDRFVDCGDVLENQDDLDMHERKQYRNVHKVAVRHYLLAKDFFSRENYKAAASKYRLVINMMHNAILQDDEEEKERNKFLIKNYTNAAVCYKKLKNYKRICIMASDAMNVDDKAVMNNAKLLYFWGLAKMNLGDYGIAKDHLRRAQTLKPQDTEISIALRELEQKRKDASEQERIMAQKFFGTNPTKKVTITEVDEAEELFRQNVKEELQRFAGDPHRTSLNIKDQKFTSQEEKIYLQEAKALGLYARVVDGEKRLIYIQKPTGY